MRYDISTFDACSMQCDETHILGCNVRRTLELELELEMVREKKAVIQICWLRCISTSLQCAHSMFERSGGVLVDTGR